MKKLVLLTIVILNIRVYSQWIDTNYPVTGKKISSMTITSDNKIFAGYNTGSSNLQNDPPYMSTNKGQTWTKVDLHDANYCVNSFYSQGRDRIVMVDIFHAHYSNDGGMNWHKYNLGIENGNPNPAIDAIINSKNYIIVGGVNIGYQNSVWISRSKDEGNSWENLTTGSYQSISKLINSPDSTIYAITGTYGRSGMGGNTDYIIRSIDDGNSWQKVFFISNSIITINFEFIKSIGCNSDGTVFVSSDRALYRSTDKGSTWVKIDSSAQHVNLINFVYDRRGTIYANNDYGIFKSNDNGSSWIKIDSTKIPTTMAIDQDDYLYIGTSVQGIFRSFATITAAKESYNELYKGYYLSQNYPNPFNPTTTIKYSIPSTGTRNAVSVQLKVFDILGREVTTLINEEKTPGNYEVKFDGTDIASGIYFYRLQAGSFSETKKFVLMK